jgi:hypothetical protein
MIMRVVPASLFGSRARARASALLCLAVALASCAQDVGDIDRTQPNLLPKAMFRDHAWFVRQTVTDVPATSAFSFVGETSTLEIVHWEIQQEYLVGYRAYEKVPGSDSDADHSQGAAGAQPVREGHGSGRDPGLFKGNPIVAYPILDQVDVIRDYNPRTGEQTNVIREDSEDRPWHERAYIRVDWSKNLVANFDFISSALSIEPTNSGYVEENEGGADAFLKHTDEQGDVDYFDFTERLFVEPTDNGCILSMNYRLGDCAGDEIKVRTSFMRVDEAREQDYVPLSYDDQRQGEFGYFRIERPTYDRRRGITWSGTQQLVTRHDLWRNSRDEDGNPVSYAQRGLRPIVYSLNQDYPEALKPITVALARDWDDVIKETAASARGQTREQLESDLLAETGDSCMFCLDENLDGHARIGDLRYNFIYWVDHPQPAGPLGYGPSSPNPETGRIVAGMAYVYGAGVDTQSQDAQDIVDLLNGEYTPEDFLEADFVRDQVLSRRPVLASDAALALEKVELSAEPGRLLNARQRTRLETLRRSGLPPAKPGYDKARLSLIRGTPFERLLINDEVILGRGEGAYLPGDPLSDEAVEKLSPLSWGTIDARRTAAQRRDKASHHCVWLREFSDPGVIGLAKASRNAGLSGDRLWQALREDIFEGVMQHEIGHTLGLRHNFSGSADALNFHAEYWPLREQTIVSGARTVNDLLGMSCEREDASNSEGCAAQRDGRMSEFQYSTVMDYGAKFNSDIHGLGHYDRAAIAAGYGDLVEVFEPEVADAMDPNDRELVELVGDIRVPLQGSLTEFTHYTALPRMFGGRDALERRSFVPRSHYLAQRERGDAPLRVPYIACYEEYVDATPYCHRWDAGADPYEISMHYVNTYREYYPLVNFQRDRVSFSPAAVGDRMTDRFFLPLANMYQQWLLSSFGGGSGDPLLETYSELGMLRGFSLLWEVMSTPRYGSYRLSSDPSGGELYQWQSYSKLDGAYYVPPGVGRRQFSRYDVSAGFNFYQRVLEAGYFYEQIGALLALTASDASVLGIGADIDADSLAYSIPYYIVFQQEIDSLFSGIISENFQSYAPYVVDDAVVRKDLWLEDITPPPSAAPRLEVTVPWSTQLYTMLYGMSFLSSNFDTSFLTKSQVALKGEGEPVAPAPGFETVEGTDPISGRIYQAYRNPNEASESFVAARLVERLQANADALAAIPPGGTDAAARNEIATIRSRIQGDVELLEILRSLYGQFNSVLPVSFVSSGE